MPKEMSLKPPENLSGARILLEADATMRMKRTYSKMLEKFDGVMTMLGSIETALPKRLTVSTSLEHAHVSKSPLVELVDRPPATSPRTTTMIGMEDPVEEAATALVNEMKTSLMEKIMAHLRPW